MSLIRAWGWEVTVRVRSCGLARVPEMSSIIRDHDIRLVLAGVMGPPGPITGSGASGRDGGMFLGNLVKFLFREKSSKA